MSREYINHQLTHNLPGDVYNIWVDWHNHYQAFLQLATMCYKEGVERGLPISQTRMRNIEREICGTWIKPHWVGWEERHSRHRANLLVIGGGENLAQRICIWKNWELDIRTESVCRTIQNIYPHQYWYTLTTNSIAALHATLNEVGAPKYYGNHYRQFEWAEEPTHQYLPVPNPQGYLVC
jgi:hypothetical protein